MDVSSVRHTEAEIPPRKGSPSRPLTSGTTRKERREDYRYQHCEAGIMGKLITPFLPCVHLTTCGQMDMSSRELVKGRTSRIYGGANSPILSAIQSTQAHANTAIALAIAENDKPTFKVLDSYHEMRGKI